MPDDGETFVTFKDCMDTHLKLEKRLGRVEGESYVIIFLLGSNLLATAIGIYRMFITH